MSDWSLAAAGALQFEEKASALLSGDHARLSSGPEPPVRAVSRRTRELSAAGAISISVPVSPSTTQAIVCASGDNATWRMIRVFSNSPRTVEMRGSSGADDPSAVREANSTPERANTREDIWDGC